MCRAVNNLYIPLVGRAGLSYDRALQIFAMTNVNLAGHGATLPQTKLLFECHYAIMATLMMALDVHTP
jgi:hypothetical protein